MSYLSTQVQSILNELFPANPHRRVFPEHYVKYKNTKLFFDFFVREILTLIECQGRQHTEYVKHFHGSRGGFIDAKCRDNLKIEYAKEHNLFLVRINYDEEVSKELILDKANRAFNSEYNFCG